MKKFTSMVAFVLTIFIVLGTLPSAYAATFCTTPAITNIVQTSNSTVTFQINGSKQKPINYTILADCTKPIKFGTANCVMKVTVPNLRLGKYRISTTSNGISLGLNSNCDFYVVLQTPILSDKYKWTTARIALYVTGSLAIEFVTDKVIAVFTGGASIYAKAAIKLAATATQGVVQVSSFSCKNIASTPRAGWTWQTMIVPNASKTGFTTYLYVWDEKGNPASCSGASLGFTLIKN